MATMSFTEARIALEQFVKANQAAVRLGEALEAATKLEKRTAELEANVDHLQKEEKTRQTNLDAMEREQKELLVTYKKNYDEAMTKQAKDTQVAREAIEQAKAADAARRKAEIDGFNTLVQEHNGEMARLLAERAKLEASIKALTKQADEIKEKMRKFVS